MLASDLLEELSGKLEMEQRRMHRAQTKTPGFSMGDLLGEVEEEEEVSIMKEGIVNMKGVVTKKKYKPVPKNIRDIKGDPLENMPNLGKVPPAFTPKGQYTAEHKEIFTKAHKDCLWVN